MHAASVSSAIEPSKVAEGSQNVRVVLEGSGAELLGNEHVKRAYLGM